MPKMTMLATPILVAILFAAGALIGVANEHLGTRAGNALLSALALCAVLGLAAAMMRSPNNALGSFAQLTQRTMVD